MSVTKQDICKYAAQKLGKSPTEIKVILETILSGIYELLAKRQRIELRKFGRFTIKEYKPRVGRNPKTGQAVPLSARIVPIFRFSKEGQKIFTEVLKKSEKESTQ